MGYVKQSGIFAMMCLFALLAGTYANATNISSSSIHSAEIKFIAGTSEGSTNDLLYVRAANSSGISFNKFDHFDVSGKSLKIINVARRIETLVDSTPTLVETDEATRIVIMANNISLGDEIELVGPASDIIFLSSSASGAISCTNCSFKNFNRIALATADSASAISDDSTKIGQLSSNEGGSITINSMKAPDALSVDLLANNLTIQNEISTLQKVNKDARGGYVQNDNGEYSIGSGGINLLFGLFNWDYENQEITKVYPQNVDQTLSGTLRGVSVNISSSKNLTLSSHINTHTDLLSASRYQGQVHLTNNSIKAKSLGGDLIINNSLSADSIIRLAANGDLTATSNSSFSAPVIQLMAKNSVNNFTRIEADEVTLEGDTVLNRGEIETFTKLQIWAEHNILNNFGGRLIGPDIILESKLGIVRNGSRYPYLASSQDSMINATANPTDIIHIGSFYRSDTYVESIDDRIAPSDTSAHILAKRLNIKSSAVENVNPYWEEIDESDSVSIDKALVNQVIMSGKELVQIEASNYLLNSSAVIRVDDVAGVMAIKAPTLTNERYRVLSKLEKEVTTVENEDLYSSGETVITSFKTRALTYSPPGYLLSMGNFALQADRGFVNNISYLEVFGNAQFNTPVINDIGLEHTGIEKSNINTSIFYFNFISGGGIVNSTSEEISIPNASEMDSLFFVHGDIMGNQAIFKPKTSQPFDVYKDLAAQSVIDREYSDVEEGTVVTSSYGSAWCTFCGTQTILETSLEDNIDGDTITVALTETNSTYHSAGIYRTLDSQTVNEEISTFSLVDELLKIWDQIVEFFSGLLAEINWWSE